MKKIHYYSELFTSLLINDDDAVRFHRIVDLLATFVVEVPQVEAADADAEALGALVERFDIEPFPDFSAK